MTIDTVTATIFEIIDDLLPAGHPPPAVSDRLADDLGLDSIRKIELALAVEKRFGLPRIDEDTAMNIVAVRDLVALVADFSNPSGPA
ncbi:acyl carrier protein [Nocardia takedensis]